MGNELREPVVAYGKANLLLRSIFKWNWPLRRSMNIASDRYLQCGPPHNNKIKM